MKNDLLVQYGAIRETIKTNVETIGRLFRQAESLKKIVESVAEGQSKQDLSSEITRIEETIGNLIVQTNSLFDKYNEFVEAVFSGR